MPNDRSDATGTSKAVMGALARRNTRQLVLLRPSMPQIRGDCFANFLG